MDAYTALALKIAEQHHRIEELTGKLEVAERSSAYWYGECKKAEVEGMFGELTGSQFLDIKDALK